MFFNQFYRSIYCPCRGLDNKDCPVASVNTARHLKELSLARSGQGCIITKVCHLLVFLSLSSFNIRAQNDMRENSIQYRALCEKFCVCNRRPKHTHKKALCLALRQSANAELSSLFFALYIYIFLVLSSLRLNGHIHTKSCQNAVLVIILLNSLLCLTWT